MSKVRKYILSLDGGGFRGLSSLVILHRIMRLLVDDPDEDPVPLPCQIFDLICGTSTGGIIAILLGRLGLDCSTAINIYKEMGWRVFGEEEGIMWSHVLAGEQFSSAGFETFLSEIVEKYTGSSNTMMKPRRSNPDIVQHQTTDVFVTTVAEENGSAGAEAYRVRSYPPPRGAADNALPGHEWTIRQAARATSATPMYFAPLQIGSQAFHDAAMAGFNNPTLEALEEAEHRWSPEDHEFVVVSLGTGLTSLLRGNIDEQVAIVLRERLANVATDTINTYEQISKQLLSVANETELTHSEAAGRFVRENRRDDYFRLNPPQGLGDLDLTDYLSEGAIIEITNVWLRSPEGKESTLAAYQKLKFAYENRAE